MGEAWGGNKPGEYLFGSGNKAISGFGYRSSNNLNGGCNLYSGGWKPREKIHWREKQGEISP